MERSYWNKIAENYEDEIFEVFKNDSNSLVTKRIKKYANTKGNANDLGCGIGSFIPHLSSHFKHVSAIDISSKCIARAKIKCSALRNVTYTTVDMAKPRATLPMADFALSVNSIITPSLKDRIAIFNTICKNIKIGGHLVLVVPSLESVMLSDARLIEWNLRKKMTPSTAVKAGLKSHRQSDTPELNQGNVKIDGVATKHYLAEELGIILESRGMKVLEIEKIQYSWDTEFEKPPKWMKAPFPWDWLCVAKKVS